MKSTVCLFSDSASCSSCGNLLWLGVPISPSSSSLWSTRLWCSRRDSQVLSTKQQLGFFSASVCQMKFLGHLDSLLPAWHNKKHQVNIPDAACLELSVWVNKSESRSLMDVMVIKLCRKNFVGWNVSASLWDIFRDPATDPQVPTPVLWHLVTCWVRIWT